MIAAANRDPDAFDHPDDFAITRSPNPHLSFGGGVHHCIGASLGRLEGRIALEALLKRYAHIELAEEPVWSRRTNIRCVSELVLKVQA
jgi:cytochrome P450